MSSSSSDWDASTAVTSHVSVSIESDLPTGTMPPTTTPTGELSTPLDLDQIDADIIARAAGTNQAPGFPTLAPSNTVVAGSVGDPYETIDRVNSLSRNESVALQSSQPAMPRQDDRQAYVAEMNNWSEHALCRFAHDLRAMGQLAVDIHKLDGSKSVVQHYCEKVTALLKSGPIPFVFQDHVEVAQVEDDMMLYVAEVERQASLDSGESSTTIDRVGKGKGVEMSSIETNMASSAMDIPDDGRCAGMSEQAMQTSSRSIEAMLRFTAEMSERFAEFAIDNIANLRQVAPDIESSLTIDATDISSMTAEAGYTTTSGSSNDTLDDIASMDGVEWLNTEKIDSIQW